MIDDYVRVTDVLKPFSGYGTIPQEILNKAADRGDRAHSAIDTYISGLGEIGIDDDVKPYLNSAKQFWGDGYPILIKEERMFSDKHLITGKADVVINADGKNILVDWKTSSKENKTWKYQGAAYVYLLESHYQIDEVWFVKLSKEGRAPKVYQYHPLEPRKRFFEMLEIYNEFFKNGKDTVDLEFL